MQARHSTGPQLNFHDRAERERRLSNSIGSSRSPFYEQGNNKLKLDSITSIGLWVGLALTALGWFKVIPLLYGWIGFAIAVPSFIVEEIKKKNMPPSKSDDNSG